MKEINHLGLGISVCDTKVSALLYADDIALVSLTEQDMQRLLDTLHDCCKGGRYSLIQINRRLYISEKVDVRELSLCLQ